MTVSNGQGMRDVGDRQARRHCRYATARSLPSDYEWSPTPSFLSGADRAARAVAAELPGRVAVDRKSATRTPCSVPVDGGARRSLATGYAHHRADRCSVEPEPGPG